MSYIYYAWNDDYTCVVRREYGRDPKEDGYMAGGLLKRIGLYKRARKAHKSQLDNECIGLAMLVKEGYLSKDMQMYIQSKFVYRSVPLPKLPVPIFYVPTYVLESDVRLLKSIFGGIVMSIRFVFAQVYFLMKVLFSCLDPH